MVESGLLGEDDPIELLNGVMVWKMPKKPKHSTVSRRCERMIERLIPPGWHVRKEEPVRIPDYDEPEPDIAVVRGDDDLYEDRHPGPGDVALIIEVAESSLLRDRGEKSDDLRPGRNPRLLDHQPGRSSARKSFQTDRGRSSPHSPGSR